MKSMLEISDELVISLAMSPETFPVNLNSAWKWIGYASKQCAKNRLLSSFKQGVDYLLFKQIVNRKVGATTTEVVKLTFKCFKHLAIAKGTSLGLELGRRLEFGEIIAQSTQVASPPSLELRSPHSKFSGKSEAPLCQQISEPLTNIKMAICLLDQPLLPAQRQQYLAILRGECDRAIALSELVSKLDELATSTNCEPLPQSKRAPVKALRIKSSSLYPVRQLVTSRLQLDCRKAIS